ncbi:hypothetical protein [Brucella anthropi]|uniref:hypothetical protein n=1 Tax=Brucella anthropi TaxID=529 RepID=UPI00124D8CF2|nr:hypothetical protein [Brucella anthropi]KAB2743517.1 hypothetical protein F9L05_23150 [Brucella anthropi]
MTSHAPMKYLKHNGDGWKMHWRHSGSRFGCDRSRRILNRFPEKADVIARATVEAGSRVRVGKAVRHA